MSATTTPPPVMDDLSADIAALFELLDFHRRDRLLEHWQQLREEQRAAKAATA